VNISQPDGLTLGLSGESLFQKFDVFGKQTTWVAEAIQLGPHFLASIRSATEQDTHLFNPLFLFTVQMIEDIALRAFFVIVVAVLSTYFAPMSSSISIHAFQTILIVLRVFSSFYFGPSKNRRYFPFELLLFLLSQNWTTALIGITSTTFHTTGCALSV